MKKETKDRDKLLDKISALQVSYFEKYKEYEIVVKVAPDSDECKALDKECTQLYKQSCELIDLL